MINNSIKAEKIMLILTAVIFILGALAGVFYMAFSNTNDDLYLYLSGFFENFSESANRFGIFKNSLADSFRISIILIICGFFKLGIIGSMGCCASKGFISGFTTAAFVRYYGARGLLVPLSSLLSTLIFIPVFLFFCTYSSCFSLKKPKRDKNSFGFFLIFALICITIFCIVSFMDGYVTTTFMKLFKPFIVKMQ